MRNFVKHQAIVWLALLGVLFGSLAPTVSHAMASSNPRTIETQICSSAGMVTMTVMLDHDGAPAGDGPMHMFEHCPYCSQHGHAAAPPPAPQEPLAIPALASGYPDRFYQSATPLFTWSASNPRAPPAPR